jgi:hypothetical protein
LERAETKLPFSAKRLKQWPGGAASVMRFSVYRPNEALSKVCQPYNLGKNFVKDSSKNDH